MHNLLPWHSPGLVMRIVSRLRGGLERRQSIFIPETFVKVIPLQSTGFIFITLRVVILSAKSWPSERFGYKFNSRSHPGILLHVWNFVKNKFSSTNVWVFGVGETAFRGVTRRDEVGSWGPLPLQGSSGLLKAKQWSRKISKGLPISWQCHLFCSVNIE